MILTGGQFMCFRYISIVIIIICSVDENDDDDDDVSHRYDMR